MDLRGRAPSFSARTRRGRARTEALHVRGTCQVQKCTSKGIRRQGVVLRHRNSLQKSLRPVICPYLCSSDKSSWLADTRCEALLGIASQCASEGQIDPKKKSTANLRTKIPDFRGFDSSRISIVRGEILTCGHVHREFNGKFESSNLSRNNISREIGRKPGSQSPGS